MTSERYLAIIRPVVRTYLRVAREASYDEQQRTPSQFKSFYGVDGVTHQEFTEALQWLYDALENAQVIVRLDVVPKEG